MEGLMTGVAVYSSDNERLGTVKEVSGQRYKVDVHFHPDYWLNESTVASIVAGAVRLNVTKSFLIEAEEGLARPSMTGNLNK